MRKSPGEPSNKGEKRKFFHVRKDCELLEEVVDLLPLLFSEMGVGVGFLGGLGVFLGLGAEDSAELGGALGVGAYGLGPIEGGGGVELLKLGPYPLFPWLLELKYLWVRVGITFASARSSGTEEGERSMAKLMRVPRAVLLRFLSPMFWTVAG